MVLALGPGVRVMEVHVVEIGLSAAADVMTKTVTMAKAVETGRGIQMLSLRSAVMSARMDNGARRARRIAREILYRA